MCSDSNFFFFFFITGIAENVSNREENNKENKNTTLIALGCIRKIEELFFFFFWIASVTSMPLISEAASSAKNKPQKIFIAIAISEACSTIYNQSNLRSLKDSLIPVLLFH